MKQRFGSKGDPSDKVQDSAVGTSLAAVWRPLWPVLV